MLSKLGKINYLTRGGLKREEYAVPAKAASIKQSKRSTMPLIPQGILSNNTTITVEPKESNRNPDTTM